MVGFFITGFCFVMFAPVVSDSGYERLAHIMYWVAGGCFALAVMVVN